MKRLVALFAAAVMVLAMAAPAVAGKPADTPAEKVWVCHATHSETNPWVIIRVSKTAWLTGHSGGGPALHQDIDTLIDWYPGLHQGPAAEGVCGVVISPF
jgi:purine nucleoside permease